MEEVNNSKIKYQKRIVVFLDILGFENSLDEFEEEAIKKYDDKKSPRVIISKKANQFIRVFKDVISLMDNYDCKYYLFSDNICITVDPYSNRDLAIDILFTISTLFKRFSDMGYFLRGGVDFGWMLDEDDIALGVPLAQAYKIESEIAIFPRVVVSDNFIEFVNDFNLPENDQFNLENFIIESSDISYINTFYNIIRTDDKINFLDQYKEQIERKLIETKSIGKVYAKYYWLRNEFNVFIEKYLNDIEYFEQDIIFTKEDLEIINKTKIN